MASKDEEKKARKAARKEAAERRRAAAEEGESARRDSEPADDEASASRESDDGEERALAVRSSGGELAAIDRDDAAADDEAGEGSPDAAAEAEAAEAEMAAGQLGTERYVLAGFFGTGILGAYVVGRLIHGVWSSVTNKDWFVRAVPRLAAVADDDKTTYGTIIAGVIALIVVVRIYRKPEVRTWSDEVASELTKVKWPTKKEVTSSTMIVIAASTVATLYLMLLDRLWAFITNLVYGSGS